MVKIAHPNHREWIEKAYYEMSEIKPFTR